MLAFLLLPLALAEVFSVDGTHGFELPHDGTVEFSLKSNPTTGYSWNIVESDSALQLDSPTGVYQSSSGGRMGGSGKQVFKVSCTADCLAGTQLKIKLHYQRPWESEPVKVEELTVDVVA